VVAKERIREFVRYVNRERETTIILTTHDLTDVERLCERVMILDHGHLLYDGSLAALVERFEDHRLLILSLDQIPQDFHVDGLPDPTIEGHQLTFRFDHRKISASEVLVKLNGCFQPSDIEIKRPSIESTIRRIYEDQLL